MKIPPIGDRFNAAYQATDQANKIAELQAEIEKLRQAQSPLLESQIQSLREQLLTQSGELEVAVDLIDPNPYQPRQTITLESIQLIARSMEKDGQIAPLILILISESGRYLLWDGHRRWEVAKLLGWKTVRAVVALMPKDLHRKALLTFIHHEDLNPLDKAEAILKEVATVTEISIEAIPTVLSTVLRRLERSSQANQLATLVDADTLQQIAGVNSLVGDNEVEAKLLLALLDLALNPASVKANLLPMLSLPDDLKLAIRERGLKGAHASALASLSAKNLKVSEVVANNERISATEKVISQDLTVAKTRELVAQIKARYNVKLPASSKNINALVRATENLSTKVMTSASNEELVSLRETLSQKITEIDRILGS